MFTLLLQLHLICNFSSSLIYLQVLPLMWTVSVSSGVSLGVVILASILYEAWMSKVLRTPTTAVFSPRTSSNGVLSLRPFAPSEWWFSATSSLNGFPAMRRRPKQRHVHWESAQLPLISLFGTWESVPASKRYILFHIISLRWSYSPGHWSSTEWEHWSRTLSRIRRRS